MLGELFKPVQETRFDYHGYPCVVLSMPMGYRCGYVGIPKGNKYYQKDYNKIPVNCHGGLTYSENELYFQPDSDMWWIGYDCNHYMDLGLVRSLAFCETECKNIVDQIILLNKIGRKNE
jgi:hypothetical protein